MSQYSTEYDPTIEVPRRLKRAETVLRKRTGRIVLVLGNLSESFNQQATIRTAESMGVQYVYCVRGKADRGKTIASKILKGSKNWITLKTFNTVDECLSALREESTDIWVLQQARNAFMYDQGTGSMTEGDAKEDCCFSAPTIPMPLEPIFFASHAHEGRRPPTNTEQKALGSVLEKYQQQAMDLFQDDSQVEIVDSNASDERYTVVGSLFNAKANDKQSSIAASGDAQTQTHSNTSTMAKRVFMPPFPFNDLLNSTNLTPETLNGLSYFGFPKRVALVISTEGGVVHPQFGLSASRHVYLEQFGLMSEGFSLSVNLAVALDRLFALCPEARGDLTAVERATIRERWYSNLASNAEQHIEFNRFLAWGDKIETLDDVRVEDATKTSYRKDKLQSKFGST